MVRRVHLCLGHTGSTGGKRGAVHTTPAFETFDETQIVRAYVMHAAKLLEAKGVAVEIDGADSYYARQQRAARGWALAYVDCHINAGWSQGWAVRGTTFHTPDAIKGKALARALAGQLGPLSGGSKVWETSPDDWRSNAHTNLTSTGNAPACVYEPAFIDCPDHWPVLRAPEQIGRALAAGILEFLERD